jgi:hypothetical protein
MVKALGVILARFRSHSLSVLSVEADTRVVGSTNLT